MITLWGAKNSGKTVFLIALYHEILHSKKEWRIQPCDLRSTQFIEQANLELVEKHQFPQPSMGDAPKDRIYTFDIRIPRAMGMKGKNVQFDFLDPGGEIFEKPELDAAYDNIVFNTIKESSGLICLLDSTKREEHEYFSLFIKNFYKLKTTFSAGRGFHEVPIPVALCVSKMDKEDNFVNDPQKFNIDTYTRELIGEASFRMLITHLKFYKIFGVSSLGWDKNGKRNYFLNDEAKMCPSGKLNPVHVMEAVEWLLRNNTKK
jgi:hypothetical protein